MRQFIHQYVVSREGTMEQYFPLKEFNLYYIYITTKKCNNVMQYLPYNLYILNLPIYYYDNMITY